jgi:hypothetical protein
LNGRSIFQVKKIATSISEIVGKTRFSQLSEEVDHERTDGMVKYNDPELGDVYLLGRASRDTKSQQLFILSPDGSAIGVCLAKEATAGTPSNVEWFGRGWTAKLSTDSGCLWWESETTEARISAFKVARGARR